MPFSAKRAASQKRRTTTTTTRGADTKLDHANAHAHGHERSKPIAAPWRPSPGSITPPEREEQQREEEERWVPPMQASSLAVVQSVIRRDGGQCVLCGDNGSIEVNPLECVKIAWHDTNDNGRSEQVAVCQTLIHLFIHYSFGEELTHSFQMRWLKATRSISVDFSSRDPMNLVTRQSPLSPHFTSFLSSSHIYQMKQYCLPNRALGMISLFVPPHYSVLCMQLPL